jgi:hypothetical protein
VIMADMTYELTRVATDNQIAPCSEPLRCSMPGAVSASLCAAPLPSVLELLRATTASYEETN